MGMMDSINNCISGLAVWSNELQQQVELMLGQLATHWLCTQLGVHAGSSAQPRHTTCYHCSCCMWSKYQSRC